MAIEKMEMLSLSFDKDKLNTVLGKLKDKDYFYPQPARRIVNNVKGVVTVEADADVKNLLDRSKSIAKTIGLDLKQGQVTDLNRKYVSDTLDDIDKEISTIAHSKEELVKEKEEDESAYYLLRGISDTDLNFEELMNCKYLTARVGRIRKRNEDKLDYYKSEMVMFLKLGETKKHLYCLYVTPKQSHLIVDNVFSSIGFREVKIPDFVHGTVEDAKAQIKEQIDGMKKYIKEADKKLNTVKELRGSELLKIYSYLNYSEQLEEEKEYVVDYSSKYAVYGFIPSRLSGEMTNDFAGSGVDFKSYPPDMYEERGIVAPTLAYNPGFARPFEGIAKVKQQDHIDMTMGFAVLYIATFLLLLGDIGLGAVLIIIGLLMHKKNSGKLLAVLGCASLIGGFLYGDVFFAHSLYPSLIPQGNLVHRLLNAVVIIAVGTYILDSIKVIYNEKSMVNKVFSMKGIVGIILVLLIASYFAISFDTHLAVNFLPLIVVLIIGVLVIFIKNAIHKKNI